jgi:hypothetical protein
MTSLFSQSFSDILMSASRVTNALGARGIGRSLTSIRTLLGVGGIAGAVGAVTVGFTALAGYIDRLSLPTSVVKSYGEEWGKVAIQLRSAARGFAEIRKEQAQGFGALGIDAMAPRAIDKALTRVAAMSGSKEDKIDVLTILTGLSFEEAEKKLEQEIKRLNAVISVGQARGARTRMTRAEFEGVSFGMEDAGYLRSIGVFETALEIDKREKLEDEARKNAEKLQDAANDARVKAAKETAEKLQAIWEQERDEYLAIQEQMADGVQDALDEGERNAERMSENAIREVNAINDEWMNKQDEMSEYALQAARNMQSAFADFLFDPFDDGLKGMLRGFVDMIRRMIAEAAAAKIFDGLGGFASGSGLASVGGFFKNLLGFANGGSFMVGGSGGTDSSVVAFRATPGETVSVSRPGRPSGSVSVTVVQNNDFRGATTDLIKQMPAILDAWGRKTVDASRAAVFNELSRRGMAI